MCINYALLGFCLCHFRRHKDIKRFNSVCLKQIKYLKKIVLYIIMLIFSHNELKKIAKSRGIKGYKKCLKTNY